MKSQLRVCGLLVVAMVTGILAGQLICAAPVCRNLIGHWCERGELVALVEGAGLYECDVERAQAEWEDRSPESSEEKSSPSPMGPVMDDIVANLRAQQLARCERVDARALERQVALAQFQFQSKTWLTALQADALSPRWVRGAVAENLRTQSWIEKQIQPLLVVRPEECAAFYDAHQSDFEQSQRIRVSHIFLAAPLGSDAGLVEAKRLAAAAILDRIVQGEKWADLVINSEDESSKKRGGDLNFFSETRVPSDFWSQLKSMAVGPAPLLIRTALGFHLVQVTDALPARPMKLEEMRPEILVLLENEKRASAVAALASRLVGGPLGLQKP